MYEQSLVNLCQLILDKKQPITKVIRSQLESVTVWMDDFYVVPTRIRCLTIVKGYTRDTFPRCPECSKPVGFDKEYQKCFNQFCSNACSLVGKKRLREDTYQKLADKEWLYHNRIVLQKSFESLAEELGCSVQPIKTACGVLGIPHVRFNESQALTMSFLRNKEWLYNEHVLGHRQLWQIAAEIGSSLPTLSRWFNLHGIKTNDSNSYDRKGGASKECEEVIAFIKSLGERVAPGENRKILGGRGIDIVLEDKDGKRLPCFEYNGIFSHIYRPDESTYALIKDSTYHLSKTMGAAEKGYNLLHIWSDDWLYRAPIWKSIIRSKLGYSQKIPANKCSVVRLTPTQKNQFLNFCHLQGKDKATIAFGLKYLSEIVAVMTFCPSRFNKQYSWELSRFASKLDHTIVGGFSKLLAAFRSNYQGSIISYASRDRSTGDVYLKNGFRLLRVNPPTWWVVDLSKNLQRMHRMNYWKNKGKKMNDFREISKVLKERELDMIFDCGTLAFVLD